MPPYIALTAPDGKENERTLRFECEDFCAEVTAMLLEPLASTDPSARIGKAAIVQAMDRVLTRLQGAIPDAGE